MAERHVSSLRWNCAHGDEDVDSDIPVRGEPDVSDHCLAALIRTVRDGTATDLYIRVLERGSGSGPAAVVLSGETLV